MKKIKVGVVGTRRGMSFAIGAGAAVGMELVAMCDVDENKLAEAAQRLHRPKKKLATYTDYDRFLAHDMDAVILADFFHQHAPYAIKALEAGKHVMSETAACFTMAEGVALIEAVEKSGLVYMFAENYPYAAHNQEMRKLYRAGAVGEFMYGEGEYVHPDSADFWDRISPGVNHWRNWLPATYYCTHCLGPMMFITETRPAKVNAFVIPYRRDDPVRGRRPVVNDACSMIALRMDSGAVVKLLQFFLRGHGSWVRIHGSRGLMENLRFGDQRMLRVIREQYHEERTVPVEQVYLPNFPEHHERAIRAGHGGGDFFMNWHFAEAIRKKRQPWMNVHRGVAMSIVGILAWRSAVNDSATVEIPDLRNRKERDRWRGDHWNPDPTRTDGKPCPTALCSPTKPGRQALAYARKIWKQT